MVANALSCPPTIGPGKVDNGSNKVKAPTGSLFPPTATARLHRVANIAAADPVLDYRRVLLIRRLAQKLRRFSLLHLWT